MHQEREQFRRHGEEFCRRPRAHLQPPGVDRRRGPGRGLLRDRQHCQVRYYLVKLFLIQHKHWLSQAPYFLMNGFSHYVFYQLV